MLRLPQDCSDEEFKEINEAYAVLSDADARSRYDRRWQPMQVGQDASAPCDHDACIRLPGCTHHDQMQTCVGLGWVVAVSVSRHTAPGYWPLG
jgi:curved DNA-binding protein CbpA